MPTNTQEVIKGLADQLGVAADHLWSALEAMAVKEILAGLRGSL